MLKPFFSIIVPCYNCEKTIGRLLDSILSQNLKKYDYEVIICDDNSTDNFLTIVKEYENKMNIIYCKTTRDFHCPGNTREAALPYATGEWICFIDNDDMFEPDVFGKVRNKILFDNIQTILVGNLREWKPDTDEFISTHSGEEADIWLHGKFYNRQFLIDYDVHFKEDLFSHEDGYFNNVVLGHLIGRGEDYHYIDLNIYRWVVNPESLSRSYFNKEHYYIDEYLVDYMTITDCYFDFAKRYKDRPGAAKFYFHQVMMTLLHAYFYNQAEIWRNGNKYIAQNLVHLHNYKNKIVDTFNITENDIVQYIYSQPKLYDTIKYHCYGGSNPFVESQSFKDFIFHI